MKKHFIAAFVAVLSSCLVLAACDNDDINGVDFVSKVGSVLPFDVSLDGYTRTETGCSLKDYYPAVSADVLYFDWYDDTDWLLDYTYSDENGEVFCRYESVLKVPEDILASVWIFGQNSGVEFSAKAASFGVQTTTINGVEVEWACGGLDGYNALYAKVSYCGSLYFVELDEFNEDTAGDWQNLLAQMFH